MTYLRRTPLRRALSLVLPGAFFLGLMVVLVGCTGRYRAQGYATTTVSAPRMVAVSDGVWVVEGRSEPVFYSDQAYWRYDNGAWYRSSYVDGGFVHVQAGVVPVYVRSIERPRAYVRYRAPARAQVRVVPRTHVRGNVRVQSPRPQVHVRDNRRQGAAVRVRSPEPPRVRVQSPERPRVRVREDRRRGGEVRGRGDVGVRGRVNGQVQVR